MPYRMPIIFNATRFVAGVRNRLSNFGRRLRRAQDGTSAIEFALLGVPFIALLVAILETGLVFFSQQLLQTATTAAVRSIMTGQAQTAGTTSAQFKQSVCDNASSIFNCANMYVNVQKFSTFSGMSQMSPISNGSFNSAGLSYAMGGPGDIILVQTFYKLAVSSGPLGFNISNIGGGQDLIVGTAVFRNEPYK